MKHRKKRMTALMLNLFFGYLGLHRIYLEHYISGTLFWLLTLFFIYGKTGHEAAGAIVVIWTLIDFFNLLVGLAKDGKGQKVDW